ncbi:thioredoxin-related protein [Lutibacter sp. Hel_I_33_5]|uniref:thioredoxin family protein n=1 Tax=Lutibacter sp. Hel_I_33_5 TaxID=1566289 RepID=UPI0011A9D2F1|nr:thioredoxin fold domain-containing protein [Lutibacter sp. Hel_I_33_5]TVZ56157.1 thioredoxin-related protein [Lutibacter sp. Hel_I_33_5]
MKKNILLFLLFFGCLTLNAQNKNIELKVHTFSEVEKLHQQNPKTLVVFIYTDWCKFCHGMKKTTFKNEKVIQLLNDNFYFVTLNAEQKESITFLGKTFVFKSNGSSGIHELAKELALKNGRISYPTTTILNNKFEIDLQVDGYINSKKMTRFLKSFN